MNPIAFEIFGMEVRWYGVIIALGVIAAFLLTYLISKRKDLNFDFIIDGFLWCFPVGIIGARLYYVAFEFDQYESIWDMINIRSGGIAIHGGLIAGILAAFIFTKIKKINFLEYIDVVMPGIILAQAIGRWGNFMNQEAHGGPVTESFISNFPEFIQQGMLINGTYYHPTFLYESVWNVLVCLILLFIVYKKKKQHGVVLGGYMIFYSIGRFFIEGLRTDSLMFLGLRIAQIVSLAGVVAGIILIIYANKASKKYKNKYSF